MTTALVMLAVGAAGGGCRSQTPVGPSSPDDLSGTWRGTISDPVAGASPVTVTLRSLLASPGLTGFAGTWQASFPPETRTTSGIASAYQLTTADRWLIYLDPPGLPRCTDRPLPFGSHGQAFELAVTRTGNRLTGTSTYRTCTESFDGSVELMR